MTYKELLKSLAGYSGNWDDEVVFVNYGNTSYTDPLRPDLEMYKVTSVGITDGLCRLNNSIQEIKPSIIDSFKKNS